MLSPRAAELPPKLCSGFPKTPQACPWPGVQVAWRRGAAGGTAWVPGLSLSLFSFTSIEGVPMSHEEPICFGPSGLY